MWDNALNAPDLHSCIINFSASSRDGMKVHLKYMTKNCNTITIAEYIIDLPRNRESSQVIMPLLIKIQQASNGAIQLNHFVNYSSLITNFRQ